LLPQYCTNGRNATPFPPGPLAVEVGVADGDWVAVRVGVGVGVGVRVGVLEELGVAVGVGVGVGPDEPPLAVSMTKVTLSAEFSREKK